MSKNGDWKHRFNEIVKSCQDELKKTTDIGRKMLMASKTNTELHESYEELGQLVKLALNTGELQWDNPKAKDLIDRINENEKNLEFIEKEVNKIKFAPGPVDVSKDDTTKDADS